MTNLRSLQRAVPMVTLILVLATISVSSRGELPAGERAVAFTIHRTGAAGSHSYTVVATETRSRADFIAPPDGAVLVENAILWKQGAPGLIALNSKSETWYELAHRQPFAPHSRFLTPLPEASVVNVKWQWTDAAPGDADGIRRYKGALSYEVHAGSAGERVKIFCDATVDLTTTSKVDRGRWLGQIIPSTTYAAVDDRLAASEAAIAGFPIRIALSARRRYEGGAPMEEHHVIEVVDIREATVQAAIFQVPASYRMQRPQYGVPGH